MLEMGEQNQPISNMRNPTEIRNCATCRYFRQDHDISERCGQQYGFCDWGDSHPRPAHFRPYGGSARSPYFGKGQFGEGCPAWASKDHNSKTQ